jgi:hypothetical protein
MSKNEKISVTKEKVGPLWDKLEEQINVHWELLNRIYKYSHWVMNLSLGLLGFFFAILMQIKMKIDNPPPFITSAIIIFISLGLSISIGFYIRVRYEIVDIYKTFREGLNIVFKFLKRTGQLLEEKGAEIDSNLVLEIKFHKMDRFAKEYPMNLLYLQFMLLLISIIKISIYVMRYLFS